MDRRDFLKTVAITGAALSIQHSEAMEILTQTINNTNGGNPDLVAVMGGEPEAMFRRAISELGRKYKSEVSGGNRETMLCCRS